MRKNTRQGAKTTNVRRNPIHIVKNVTFIYVLQKLKIVLNHFMKNNNAEGKIMKNSAKKNYFPD
jgi:hypothetical protein